MRAKLLAFGLSGSIATVPAAATAAGQDAQPTDPTALGQRVETTLTKEAATKLHAALQTAKRRQAAARRRTATTTSTSTQAGAPGPAVLQAIAQCESSGNPSARSGPYGGLFQFDQQTWASVGGSGDPAAASPQEQQMRASMLYQQRGLSAWPVCGAGK